MGNAASFTKALKPHHSDAFRYCRMLCARWSPSDTEDVMQQALMTAFERFDDLRDVASFRPWLFKIINRTFHMAVRRSFWKRFVPIDQASDVPRMPEVYHRPERSEDKLLLLNALARLSTKERTALLLFEVGGFSIEEIVSIQEERSLSTIKMRLSRARKKLRQYIEDGPSSVSTPSTTEDIEHETLKLVAQTRGNRLAG